MTDQPINDNAKINDSDQNDWQQIKCKYVPKPIFAYVDSGYVESDYVEFTS